MAKILWVSNVERNAVWMVRVGVGISRVGEFCGTDLFSTESFFDGHVAGLCR